MEKGYNFILADSQTKYLEKISYSTETENSGNTGDWPEISHVWYHLHRSPVLITKINKHNVNDVKQERGTHFATTVDQTNKHK